MKSSAVSAAAHVSPSFILKGTDVHTHLHRGLLRSIAGIILATLTLLPAVRAQSASDTDLIKQTALDYIEGWYEGNGERMERALHPELAKRIVRTNPQNGRSRLDQMSALSLVLGTRQSGGKETPKDRQLKEVTVLDIYENAASAKIVASDWIDYLHLAKWNGRWVIVNVLWELKPSGK